MRRTLASLATAAVASFGMVALAPPAEADTPNCVTKREYRRIEDGMRLQQVKRIFDRQHGIRIDSTAQPPQMQKHYEACGPAGNVAVHFRKRDGVWRVIAKERLG